jgi:hypothetical protein
VNVLALQSAHDNAGLTRVVLHFDGQLSTALRERLVAAMPKLELRAIDDARVFGPLSTQLGTPLADQLLALHAELRSPAARENVLRAALLAVEGGVYLDIETVTLRALDPLLDSAFCGAEPIAFPEYVMRSKSPIVWSRALALHTARLALRELPGGYRSFHAIEPWFARAANNAVLGAPAAHPFMHALLQNMASVPKERRHVRFALGTHLLQRTIASYSAAGEPATAFRVHEPAVFYPLGPEISRHWFRIVRRRTGDGENRSQRVELSDAIAPSTRVVHWYASVRNRAIVDQMSPAFVRAHEGRQLLSELALRVPAALDEQRWASPEAG